MKKYIRFDEIENVLSSVQMAAIAAREVRNKRNLVLWKWLIVSAHDAIQGSIICGIADSTGTNVLRRDSASKVLDWLEDPSKPEPREVMADFKTLLKKTGMKLSGQDAKDIRKLHSFRNDFVHFTPKSWLIELAGLPRIIGVALRMVEDLMATQNAQIHMSGNQKRRLAAALRNIRYQLS